MRKIVSGFAAALLLVTIPAVAQSGRDTDQLALARVCASEVGLRGSHEECAAIADVLRLRASRYEMTLSAMARVYSDRVFDTERRDGRAWLAHLSANGREPAQWPELVTVRRRGEVRVMRHAPWAAYQSDWESLYEAAGRIVSGELRSRCEAPAEHWGMRHGIDMERARRAGWEEVDCGDTRNAFWRTPVRLDSVDRD